MDPEEPIVTVGGYGCEAGWRRHGSSGRCAGREGKDVMEGGGEWEGLAWMERVLSGKLRPLLNCEILKN